MCLLECCLNLCHCCCSAIMFSLNLLAVLSSKQNYSRLLQGFNSHISHMLHTTRTKSHQKQQLVLVVRDRRTRVLYSCTKKDRLSWSLRSTMVSWVSQNRPSANPSAALYLRFYSKPLIFGAGGTKPCSDTSDLLCLCPQILTKLFFFL